MKIIKIRHFGIVVKEMAASVHFYTDILGLKIFSDNIEEGIFIDTILGLHNAKVRTVKMGIIENATLLELLEFQSHSDNSDRKPLIYHQGPRHLAIEVESVDSAYDNLIEEGIHFISPPAISPNGKAKVAFCNDPDGNPVEIVEIIKS